MALAFFARIDEEDTLYEDTTLLSKQPPGNKAQQGVLYDDPLDLQDVDTTLLATLLATSYLATAQHNLVAFPSILADFHIGVRSLLPTGALTVLHQEADGDFFYCCLDEEAPAASPTLEPKYLESSEV
jgi:hypothetical protein